MIKKKIKITFILFIFLVFLIYIFWNKLTLYIESVNIIDTNKVSTTKVTPVLDAKIELNNNLIYCSTAQMAWNSLHDDIIKETIEIENQPWYVDKLNALVNLPPQISQDAYIALAGFGKDNIIERTKSELLKKFNKVPNIQFPRLNNNDIFAFSYLKKILDFKEKFGTFYSDITFNNKSTTVKSFGFKDSSNDNKLLKKQINLLFYSNNDFIIELLTTSTTDSIVLSTIKPESTLLETYDKINILVNNSDNLLKSKNIKGVDFVNTLVIPKINFNIDHTFKELTGKQIKNLNFKNQYITEAIQCIKFKLNEKGARLESFTMFLTEGSSSRLNLEVKGPFTLFFKSKNAVYPYFMAYFGNDELLERQQNLLELIYNSIQPNE